VNSRIKAREEETNAKRKAESKPRGRRTSAEDGVEPEFRSSRIEPISRIDTNEFKEAPQMTLKVARWFEIAGRPPMAQSSRVDGRKWIESVKLGLQRAEVDTDFDSLEVTRPTKDDAHDLSYDDMLEARHCQQVATARDKEERNWIARHKPKSAGLSLSSASWKGLACRREVTHQRETLSNDMGAFTELSQGMRLREQALWLPVGDTSMARSGRPSYDRCGAVLYKGGPFKEKVRCNITGSVDACDAKDTPCAHGPPPACSNASEKALELWSGLQDLQSDGAPDRVGRSKRAADRIKQMRRMFGDLSGEKYSAPRSYESNPIKDG